MKAYLKEMKHAVGELIPSIWAEHDAVEEATAALRKYEAATKAGYQRAQSFDDLDDDEGLATFIYYDTYFGPDKKRYHAESELERLEAAAAVRAFSRSSLSASLLQFGKQGISIVHGKLDAAPAGRQVNGVQLKDVIWQGRNHALHWEDHNPHKPVKDCFETLEKADATFGDYLKRNLAFEIVQLLGWRDWETFERDMLSLS
jgi:hypothetical protein